MLLLCQKKNKTKPKTLLSFLFCSEIKNRETGKKQQIGKKERKKPSFPWVFILTVDMCSLKGA